MLTAFTEQRCAPRSEYRAVPVAKSLQRKPSSAVNVFICSRAPSSGIRARMTDLDIAARSEMLRQ